MKIPYPPDLGRPRWRLVLTALVVTVTVGLVTGFRDAHDLNLTLGDTDDAMRMVLARGLLGGQGWWDQHLVRLQPPVGVYMHWSRLLDGGIAALNWVLALFVNGSDAEWLTRLIWPLLWTFPAIAAALAITARVSDARDEAAGGNAPGAVLVCAFLLATNYILYIQFHPGRVDHHDVQMACCLLALAGGVQKGPGIRGGVLAGAATAFGLAIGLEALLFEAVIGAALALRFVFNDKDARPLRAYGLTLASATLLCFCIQTPPWRWTVVACDALAFNSTAAIVAAGLAVAAAAQFTKVRSAPIRFIALGAGALVTVAVYVLLDPHCLQGPFADVNPAIKGIWLSHVQEMRPWILVLKQKPEDAISLGAGPVMGVLALIWLARRRATRQDSAFRLTTGLLLMTMIAGFSGVRMSGYADWIAMPPVALAAADIAELITRKHRRESLIMVVIVGLIVTPASAAVGALALNNALAKLSARPGKSGVKKPAPQPPNHCFDTALYRPLEAAGKPGLVLAEIDLGPFILANTKDSALAAPYHRMSWGMLAARSVLSANADDGTAEAKARALDVRYVLECYAHRGHADRSGMADGSLQKRLDKQGDPPAWLERVNPAKSALEIFRVRPPGQISAAPAR